MDFFNVFPKLSEKRVTLSDLGIPYRVFVNWSAKNIINYKVSGSATNKEVTRKRVELDYFDALWLLIAKELRSFRLPLTNIEEIKDFLFAPMDTTNFDNSNDEELAKIAKHSLPNELNDLITEEAFNKEKIKTIIDGLPETYKMYMSNLGGLVSAVLLFELTPTLMLYKSPLAGNSKFGIEIFNPIANEFDAHKRGVDFRDEMVTNLLNYSVINIPMVPLISKFYKDEALFKYTESFALYTPSELELLKIIKQKEFKQIKIYNSHNKETFEVEITEEHDIKNNEALEIKTLLGLKQYERAEVIFRNNKHLVIKNIIKQQI